MIGKFFAILYYGLIVGVVLLGLLLLMPLVPVPGNFEVKIVQSGSMEPEIKTGSLIVMRPTGDYQVGDIITFYFERGDQVPTTHRIVEVDEIGRGISYLTKGDANNAPDPRPIPRTQVLGEVFFSIPYMGFILDFAKKPLGFVLLIGIPAGFVLFDEGVALWNELRKLRTKKEAKEEPEKTDTHA